MRIFVVLLLSLVLLSCNPQEPSKMEKYELAKKEAVQTIENNFEGRIQQTIKEENNTLAANSLQAKQELKAALKQLAHQSTTASDKKANITPLTPSTDIEDIQQLDSLSSIQLLENHPKSGALLIKVRNYQDAYSKIYRLQEQLKFKVTSEQETTTNYSRENTITIEADPAYFEEIIKSFRGLAAVIHKKYIWNQHENNDFLKIKSQIATNHNALGQLNSQLASTKNTKEKLQVQEQITQTLGELDMQTLQAKNLVQQTTKSGVTIAFFEEIDLAKPAPEPFNASFSTNLQVGWENFKTFLLNAALVWPYIIIGLIFFITILIAIGSSRRRARQFKLQAMQAQQQMNIQQQTNKTTD